MLAGLAPAPRGLVAAPRRPSAAARRQTRGPRPPCAAEPPAIAAEEAAGAAAEAAAAAPPAEAPLPPGQAKIYVGRGRFLVDDPSKYPDRTELTGGFAGGEAGLKAFVAAAAGGPPPAKPAGKGAGSEARVGGKGLYVGMGRYLPDDASPRAKAMAASARDSQLTGGFAGGEVGLRAFVETGAVPFLAPGEQRRRLVSPLIVAGIVSALGVAGGLLVTDVEELSEQVARGGGPDADPALGAGGPADAAAAALARAVSVSALDDSTRLALEVGLIAVAAGGTLLGVRALVDGLARSARDGAGRLAILAAFWLAVFVVAKVVLES
jgi:hypothetical protein